MNPMPDNLVGWALAATGAMLAIAAVISVVLLSAPGPAAGNGARGAHRSPPHALGASTGLTISARRTPVGTILVGPGREVLYAFSRDSRNREACVRIRGCVALWPLLTRRGRLRAGRGVSRSRLSTIRVAGRRQVAYAGHPLYLYAAELHDTSTDYVGVAASGGTWPAVSPRGALVR